MAKTYTPNRGGVPDLTDNYYWETRVPKIEPPKGSSTGNNKNNTSTGNNKNNTSTGEIQGPINYLGNVVDFSTLEKELYDYYYNQYSSGISGYTPQKRDITQLIASFQAEAEAAKGIAENEYQDILNVLDNAYNTELARNETSYDNKRQDLLASIKRYQQQFQDDTNAQRKAFLANQAALESARESANREVRNSMAARGLGGSGLQQLAMLQNVLGQSSQISSLANENQTTMDKLRNILNERQEDHDTSMARAEEIYNSTIKELNDKLAVDKQTQATKYNNTLASINSALGTRTQQAYDEREREYINAVNAANQARAQALNSAKQTAGANAYQAVNAYNTATSTIASKLSKLGKTYDASDLKRYADEVGLTNNDGKAYTYKEINKMDAKERANLRQLIANVYMDNFDATISDYATGYATPTSFVKTSENNINNILQAYGFNPYYVLK
jgi:hypothetical protein